MSNSYMQDPFETSEYDAGDAQVAKNVVKDEAKEFKETTTAKVEDVAGTAKAEAGDVIHETTSQAKELYATTQRELKEQAGVQQERVASGLRSIGDELGSMAANSEQPGVASDLVRQVSERMGGAASWLDARDPGSLLSEVKGYARRNPGTFIAVAAVAGVVAGRLTRALTNNAADEKDAVDARPDSATQPQPQSQGTGNPVSEASPVDVTPESYDAPLYAREAIVHGGDPLQKDGRP